MLLHSLTHSPTHSLTHTLTHSLIHSLTHSLTHPLTTSSESHNYVFRVFAVCASYKCLCLSRCIRESFRGEIGASVLARCAAPGINCICGTIRGAGHVKKRQGPGLFVFVGFKTYSPGSSNKRSCVPNFAPGPSRLR